MLGLAVLLTLCILLSLTIAAATLSALVRVVDRLPVARASTNTTKTTRILDYAAPSSEFATADPPALADRAGPASDRRNPDHRHGAASWIRLPIHERDNLSGVCAPAELCRAADGRNAAVPRWCHALNGESRSDQPVGAEVPGWCSRLAQYRDSGRGGGGGAALCGSPLVLGCARRV